MKHIVPGLYCCLALAKFTASSLAAETNAPSAIEQIWWAADNGIPTEEISHATADRIVVSPDAIVSTRSSFTAQWAPMSQAMGYLLDVSASPSFDSYVAGYHSLEVGPANWWVVTGLSPGTIYYYRVTGLSETGSRSNSSVITGTTATGSGLVISPTFDNSITNDPNAAAIEAMINRAITIYESLFSDPITVYILFRYSTTRPNGTPIGSTAQIALPRGAPTSMPCRPTRRQRMTQLPMPAFRQTSYPPTSFLRVRTAGRSAVTRRRRCLTIPRSPWVDLMMGSSRSIPERPSSLSVRRIAVTTMPRPRSSMRSMKFLALALA